MKKFKSYVTEKLQDLEKFDLLSDVRRPRTEKQLWKTIEKYPYETLGRGYFSIAVAGPSGAEKRYVLKVSKGEGLIGRDGWTDWALACKNTKNKHLPVIHGLYGFYPPDSENIPMETMMDDKLINDVKNFKYGFYAILDYIEIVQDGDDEAKNELADRMGILDAISEAWHHTADSDNYHDSFEEFSDDYHLYDPVLLFNILQGAFLKYYGKPSSIDISSIVPLEFIFKQFLNIHGGENSDMAKAYNLVFSLYNSKRPGLDMHSQNFGISESGNIVITDPFSWKPKEF